MKKFFSIFIIIFFLFGNSILAKDIQAVWDANAPEENVTSYTLYWYETTNPSTVNNKSVNAPTTEIVLSDTLFKVDTEYSFYVTARNSVAESDHSIEVKKIVRPSIIVPDDNLPQEIIITKPTTVILRIEIQ